MICNKVTINLFSVNFWHAITKLGMLYDENTPWALLEKRFPGTADGNPGHPEALSAKLQAVKGAGGTVGG